MPKTPDYKRLRVIELGKTGKLTCNQIALRLGLSVDVVWHILDRAGISAKKATFRYSAKRDRGPDS